jgi:uncharacterized protein
VDGGPMVVPTSYGRAGHQLYLHGSVASRSLRAARVPVPVCVTVTLVDGLVLARSVFNHSINYRCAMVYGVPEVLADEGQKLAGLQSISDHIVPGQWGYARYPSTKELASTTVLRLDLAEASVKVSQGPPDDGVGPDGELDVWAGEIPLCTVRLDPVADPTLRAGIELPPASRRGRTSTDTDSGTGHHLDQSRNEASGVVVMPWAAATGSYTTEPSTTLTPSARAASARTASRQPWLAMFST